MCILFLPTIQLSESNNTSFFIWRTVGFIVAKSQKIVKPMINVLQIKYLPIKKKKNLSLKNLERIPYLISKKSSLHLID